MVLAAARAMAALSHLRQGCARAWQSYEDALHRRPLVTQATTSALLWGAGDLLAQRIEHYEAQADRRRAAAAKATAVTAAAGRKRGVNSSSNKESRSEKSANAATTANDDEVPYDFGRAALTAVFGGIMVGPVGHVWYANLDRIILAMRGALLRGGAAASAAATTAAATTTATTTTPSFIAAKVLLDTAVMGPFYVAGYFTFGATVMDGGGWKEAKHKLESDFWPTLAAEVCFWPAVQGVNFWRTPVHHQLLVVNALTVADAAFMSWARAQDDWLAAVKERWAVSSGGGVVPARRSESESRWRALPEELPPPPKPHRRPKQPQVQVAAVPA
jgi:protein Mpv17